MTATSAVPPAPWLARLLLRATLDREAYEIVAGDLFEMMAAEPRDPRAARRRYWRLALRSIVAHWAPEPSDDDPRGPGRRPPVGTGLLQDLRYGLRQMRHRPGISAALAATLGLGIAATTTVFGLINALALRPLPYADPSRVVFMLGWDTARDQMRFNLRYRDAQDLAARVDALDEVASYRAWNANVSGGGLPERVQAYRVSANTFELLGVDAAVGRTFNPADLAAGDEQVVVLSHGFWMRRFGGNPGVVGQTIVLNDVPFTVRGVMPPEFEFPVFNFKGDLWTALVAEPSWTAGSRDDSPSIVAIGRLAPESTLDGAQAAASEVMRQIAEASPETNSTRGVRLTPMGQLGTEQAGPAFAVLAVAVVLVLLVACANAANLELARGLARDRELAVRGALGASRRRLVRQLLVESLWLAAAGGLLGAGLAWLALEGLRGSLPDFVAQVLPGVDAIRLDGQALAFALAVAAATVVLFGLLPAWRSARASARSHLVTGAREAGDGQRSWLRSTLVVAEVALSVALLVTTGLLARSAAHLTAADPGFDKDRLLAFSTALPATRYPTAADRLGFYTRVSERLRGLPGVRAVGVVNTLPFSTSNETTAVVAEGRPPAEGEPPRAGFRLVNPEYFAALGVPVVEGRALSAADEGRAVVNQRFVAEILADGPALGRRLWLDDVNAAPPVTIVGVVEDVQHWNLSDAPAAEIFVGFSRDPRAVMTLAVRTEGDPGALVPAVRAAVAEVDPAQAIFNAVPVSRLVENSYIAQSMASTSVLIFGGSALLLTALGLYGVLAFAVGRRTREIGVRVALGAGRPAVSLLVVTHALKLVSLGLLIGLALAMLGAQGLSSLLFGIGPFDTASYVTAAAVLLVVALLAAWLPARRALGVDPLEALRTE